MQLPDAWDLDDRCRDAGELQNTGHAKTLRALAPDILAAVFPARVARESDLRPWLPRVRPRRNRLPPPGDGLQSGSHRATTAHSEAEPLKFLRRRKSPVGNHAPRRSVSRAQGRH